MNFRKILGNNVCAYVNDCTAALQRPYTVSEWTFVNNSDYAPGCYNINNLTLSLYDF